MTLKLPKELQEIIDTVQEKSNKQVLKETVNTIEEHPNINWDVSIDLPIEFFDITLSYELSGYRPINDRQGLDFNPSWFTEARDTYLRTGHYTQFPRGTKAFRDYWIEQYKRCKHGLTINGYTITGDHYFFLNFYQLKDLENVEEAGSGRKDIFPNFLEGQYEWFHYLKIARKLKMNACMMKARSAGYSEIEAAILANSYNCIKGSINVVCAYASLQLTKILEKVWASLTFLNNCTDGGFFKSRQAADSLFLKRASQYKMINGQKVEVGWMSLIQGVVTDSPGKLRGDRTDILVFEEAGLHPGLTKTYTMADALVGQIGSLWGIRLIGGTGGESGTAVEGLRKMYYNPKLFGILPFRHNYTLTGETAITTFFLPAFKTIKDLKVLDDRGWISDEKGKEIFDRIRALKAVDPRELVTYCAEYCYTAEEAFSLEGDNKFNKLNIAELLTLIRALKRCPLIETGFLEYLYKEGIHKEENITGFKWIPNSSGKILILEHPLWTLKEQFDLQGNSVWKPPSEPINDLYVIGIDGIDIGSTQTSELTRDPSDFCLTVYRRTFGLKEPLFVCIYKDRPRDVRECYKIAIKIALYYNAIINIEATRQGIIPYARERNLLKLFMKRPRATLSDSIRNNNKQFGTPATRAIIDHQTDLISNYVEDYCHLIWFDEMLDELNRYSDDNKTKFDIVASMAMALLADEELQGIVPKRYVKVADEWQDIGFYIDEEGKKRYGILPLKDKIRHNNNFGLLYDDTGSRTSDTRIYTGYL